VLLLLCLVAPVVILIVWPVAGAGDALRVALLAGLVVALPVGVAGAATTPPTTQSWPCVIQSTSSPRCATGSTTASRD
jgi:hypothetical protein